MDRKTKKQSVIMGGLRFMQDKAPVGKVFFTDN